MVARRIRARTWKKLFITAVIASVFSMVAPLQPASTQAAAGDIRCDRTVDLATNVAWLNSVQPGQTVCVEAGLRTVPLVLANMNGTPEAPITVINYGGVVEVDANAAWTSALDVRTSKHFVITGSGDPDAAYGFRVSNQSDYGFGFSANRGSTNYTAEHIEVAQAGFAGFMLRSDPGSDTSRSDFTQVNTIVRHNFVHDVTNAAADGGYGMMIGISSFGKDPAVHEVKGLRVYDNLITNTGRNALQISGATSNVRVYNNTIDTYGRSEHAWFDSGLYIGPGTTGDFYNNIIRNGSGVTSGAGINHQGLGDVRIFNNLIVDPGAYGVISPAEAQYTYPDDPVFAGNHPTQIVYNTIVRPTGAGNGIRFRDTGSATTGNTVGYNLIVHRPDGQAEYVRVDDSNYDVSDPANNFGTHDMASVGFVDAASGDYTLGETSPALGFGYAPGMDPGPDPGLEQEPGTEDPGTEPDQDADPGIEPDYVADPLDIACDASIPSNDVRLWDGAAMGVEPGDTVCVESGVRPEILHLTNFHGTEEAPITFVNHGGIVAIMTPANDPAYQGMYALKFTASSHFILDGYGDRNTPYGFRLSTKGSNGASALVATTNSTDFTIAHVEIFGAGFAGIMLKTDPSCNAPNTTQRPTDTIQPGFVQKNTIVRDTYVHNTGGEGMYIGHYAYAQGYNTNCGVLWPHAIEGLEVYNNVIRETDLDALQISAATKDAKVYNNHLESFGLAEELYHTNGLEINPGTSGDLFNNTIVGGTGAGINYKGRGDTRIYNNVIVDSGDVGIISLAEPGMYNPTDPVFDGSPIHIAHNTIVNPSSWGIDFWNRGAQNEGNTVYNNLIVREEADSEEDYIRKRYADTDVSISNNYTTNQLSAVRFVDPESGNYRLQQLSPALDFGKDVSSEAWRDHVALDKDSTSRPSGTGYDAGAYERKQVTFITDTVLYDGEERTYALYVPEDYDPTQAYPMIVFHHGVGETGKDGLRQTEVGIGPAIGHNPKLQKAIIYMPQRGGKSTEEAQFWTEHARQIATQYNVDPERWYMTGLSAGGYITWNWGGHYADEYAALMPIAGGLSDTSEEKLSKLASLPIRALHGEDDNVIAISWGSQAAVDAVNEAGGEAELFTLPGVGHSEWDTKFYSSLEHISWLLEQRNPTAYAFEAHVETATPKVGEEQQLTLQFTRGGEPAADLHFQGIRTLKVTGYIPQGNGTAGKLANQQLRGDATTLEVIIGPNGQVTLPLMLVTPEVQQLQFELAGNHPAFAQGTIDPQRGSSVK